jgi:hypothetical protein
MVMGQLVLAERLGGDHDAEVADLTDLVVDLAADLEQAVLTWAPTLPGFWTDALTFARPRPVWAAARGGLLKNERHLMGRHTLDAYPVQVLTDEHLARARDLSRWEVREVAPGRHLVRARDVAAWFAGGPDDDVVRQAREDFGDVILSADVVAREEPTPW